MKKVKKQKYPKENLSPFQFIPEDTLDYHDFGELTAFDIEKLLNEFLEDSYIAKYSNVLVITGKGQIVRPLVERLLKTNKFVEKFKSAGHFNGQSGAFEVDVKTV